MKRSSGILLLTMLLTCGAAYGQGIVFKIPEDVFPMDWKKNGFKGILMLEKDSQSGVFISSPDDNETVEQLRERAAMFIAPMVVPETKEKDPIPFDVRKISKNGGDLEEGKYYLFKGEKSSVQILFYLRESNGSKFLYGYFASKGNDEKKSSKWADDDGKGIKILKNFVSSFRK